QQAGPSGLRPTYVGVVRPHKTTEPAGDAIQQSSVVRPATRRSNRTILTDAPRMRQIVSEVHLGCCGQAPSPGLDPLLRPRSSVASLARLPRPRCALVPRAQLLGK